LKELLRDGHSQLIQQLAGLPALRALPVEFARFNLQKVDLLFELTDGTLFHPELQSRNEEDMAIRMGTYAGPLHFAFHKPIKQSVLYVGFEPLTMPSHRVIGSHHFECPIIDIREFDADKLISSGFPSDIILSILASGGERRITEILERVGTYNTYERRRAFSFLMSLGRLRHNISTILIKESSRMPIYVEDLFLEDDPVYNEGIEVGQKIGEERGREAASAQARAEVESIFVAELNKRFQKIPPSYAKRIQAATQQDLLRWLLAVNSAPTLRDVFHSR
jgi:hypothetical protein